MLDADNASLRLRTEEALFGPPKDGARGIFYGVLQDQNESATLSTAKNYGSVPFTLRKGVKSRATITRTDTVNALSAPWNNYDPVAAMTPAVPLTEVEGAFLGRALRHPGQIMGSRSVSDLRAIEGATTDYFEVQIHGGLSAEDIEYAEFRTSVQNEQVRQWLQNNNIPIKNR